MAKAAITNLLTTQSFQNWFDKTNELVDLMKEEVMTASIIGDSTTGDATLIGNFSANNITATEILRTDNVSSSNNIDTILFQTPIEISGVSSQICSTFLYSAGGGKTRYSDGSTSWDIGMEDSDNSNFIINTGTGSNKFQLSTAGVLTVPDIVVIGTLSGPGFDALNPTNYSTNDIAEGNINLYYSTTRAYTAIDARVNKSFIDALNINASTIDNIDGTQILRNDVNGTLNGTLTIAGNLNVTGDVTTAFSASDIKLKENVVKIKDGLNKVNTLSGYTFNYTDNPGVGAVGLIAQELEKVLPEAVYEFDNQNGDSYKAIRYGNVISLLVEAIKELSNKVDELEKNK